MQADGGMGDGGLESGAGAVWVQCEVERGVRGLAMRASHGEVVHGKQAQMVNYSVNTPSLSDPHRYRE